MMKKFIIALVSLLLVFSCGTPDNGNGYGYSQTSQKKVEQPDRNSLPWTRIVGYNPITRRYVYILEAENHKFVMYGDDIEVVE